VIALIGPSRPNFKSNRGKYLVSCSVHGDLGHPTAEEWALDLAFRHFDDEGCDEPIGGVQRVPASDRWLVWCNGCGDVDKRSSSKHALALLERHMAGEVSVPNPSPLSEGRGLTG
jgi:hypothetical protein